MRELVKCYHVFLPRIWERLLLYLVYPVVLTGIGCLAAALIPLGGIIFTGELIVPAEIFLDILVFGGIASKETNKLEYLKTSVKGMTVLRKSIIADAVRRFLTVTVIYAVIYVRDGYALSPVQLVTCMLTTLFVMESTLLVTRRLSGITAVILIASVSSLVNVFALGVVCTLSIPVWVSCIAAALYIAVAAAGRGIIMKKARGSYYDARA